MRISYCGLAVASGLTLSAVAGHALGAAQTPPVGKPVEVAPTPIERFVPAEIDNELAIGGEDINARKSNTRMTVEVLVNGRGPYRFLVDSGADSSVVGHRIARDLQLPLGSPAVLHGMTASARVDRVQVASLQLGVATFSNLELPALKEQDVGGDGMIGIDALVEQRLMMDFEKRVIKAEDASVPTRMMDGEIVVTARRRRGQLILTQVRAAGLPVEAVVDTGSEVTIGNSALRDKLIRRGRGKFETVQITGVTGKTVNLQMARINTLRLGTLTLRDVPIAFADVPPFQVFGMNQQPSLLLGTDLLEQFRRVSLDFRRRKVRFQLRKCGMTFVTFSTASNDFSSRIQSGPDGAVCKR